MFRFIRRLIVILIILFIVYLMFKAVAPNTTRKLTDKIGSFYITSDCGVSECSEVISTWEVVEDEDGVDDNMKEKKEKVWFRDRVRNFFSSDDESDDKQENKEEIDVFTGETQTGQIVSTWAIIIEIENSGSSGEQKNTSSPVSDEQKEAQKVIDSLF